jgi:hypothetical protein
MLDASSYSLQLHHPVCYSFAYQSVPSCLLNTTVALCEHAERWLQGQSRPWTHTFSRCPVSVAARSEAEMNLNTTLHADARQTRNYPEARQ